VAARQPEPNSAGREVPAHPRASDPDAAREAALELLERSRRTRAQLATKLRERGFAPAVAAAVLDRLAEVGLVDDLEYASAYLRQRLEGRSASWRKLEQDLRKRGVDGEVIAQARQSVLAELGGTGVEVQAARRVLAQVARRYAGLDPRVRRQRLVALLARRGFDYSTIAEAMEEPAAEE
jgi:regulatory protein